MDNLKKYFYNKHPFHLVEPSLLPFILSIFALMVVISGVLYMHQGVYSQISGVVMLVISLIFTLYFMGVWWLNVIHESYVGYHNERVAKGLKLGFILFIVSEVMFFFGFFWAFFHSSLAPAIELGSIWPPLGIEAFNPLTFPFLNTIVLLLSGVSITFAHLYMLDYKLVLVREGFLLTLAFALLFSYIQFDEFYNSPFSISDGIYGSCFFMITGLHGFHVIIGTIFIFICYLRYKSPSIYIQNKISSEEFIKSEEIDLISNHNFYVFRSKIFLGFEFASWYWHFVDVVWLYVYTFLYWWGSS